MGESKILAAIRKLKILIPPPQWRMPVSILMGILFGLGFTAFRISNASSYLSDDPKACINCHVMFPQYSSWQHSSHRQWTNCNDCHVPHDSFVRKYYFKASDGTRHATMFTLRMEPQAIRIHDAGKTVVQENCIRCHNNLLSEVTAIGYTAEGAKHGEGKLCWDCHREVPHGRISSLSSSPNAIIPDQQPAAPAWLLKMVGQNSDK